MSEPISDTLSAFPYGQISEATGQPINGCFSPGMTLRDWFAGQALPIAAKAEHEFPCGADHEPTYSGIADRCYLMADAMIKARNSKLNA